MVKCMNKETFPRDIYREVTGNATRVEIMRDINSILVPSGSGYKALQT